MSEFARIILSASVLSLGFGILFIIIISRRVSRRLRTMTDAAMSDMTKKLAKSMDDLRSEKEEISGILRSMVEQVIAADISGIILYLNPAAEKIFGVKSEQAVGKSFLEVVRHAAISSMFTEVLGSRKEIFKEVRLFLPEEKIFEAKTFPIRGEGKDRGVLLVLHDISKIKQLEDVRKDFVANVSHELRTPLTSIQGYAETLLSGALSDDKNSRDFVQTIHDQAERLSSLVNDLLDLSAIESGKKPPKPVPFPLHDLVNEVAGSLSPFAKKHQVRFENNVPAALHPLMADRDQIKQVLINLVDNAIKFSHKEGTVTVEASGSDHDFMFSVKDTGVGIPASDIPRLFERFYRVDKGRSRELGGTGLGLAIVKHIVDAHGGAVRVESAPNEGSKFIVSLPGSAP